MKIWVDADACPKVIKEIIFRASMRTNTPVILVANRPINIPLSPLISTIQVSKGFDMADDRIIESMEDKDIVITGDIPLADAVIDKGAIAINPSGKLYTKENIKDRLAARDLMDDLRNAGMINGGGPRPFSLKERQAFANKLDAILASRRRLS